MGKQRTDIRRLREIPNVGPATSLSLNKLGISKPFELIGQDPYAMHEELSRLTGKRIDPCLIDVFIAAIRFMEGEPARKWWYFTEERKRVLSSGNECRQGLRP